MILKRLPQIIFVFFLAIITAALLRPLFATADKDPLTKNIKNLSAALSQKDFSTKEIPRIKLTPVNNNPSGIFAFLFKKIPPIDIPQNVKYSLTDSTGRHFADPSLFHLQPNSDGTYSLDINTQNLPPGKYQVTITDTTTNHNIGTGDFTFSAWVKPSSLSGYRTVLSSGISSPAFYASLNGGNFGLSWSGDKPSGRNLATETWQHIIITRSGTTVKYFLNGKQTPNSYTISTSIDNSALTFASSDYSQATQPFSSLIDDIRFYNYSVSLEQAKLIYNNGAVRINP